MGYRERLLLEYHNGPLGGHPGRERTCELLEKDWWWPHMFEDVRRWCARCQDCASESGLTGASAWTRTEFFNRPFRALQFDTITCRDKLVGDGEGTPYVLTVICCFSRWCWLIPIEDRTSEKIANGLLYRVFLGVALFPAILRSDNAKEFVSEVVARLNRTLEIRHITGSTYHPQSQGMVERMHRTVNKVVRSLVDQHPDEWEAMLPFAETILRIMPMQVLGKRSPYEVVTGLRPRLPTALDMSSTVQDITVDEYSQLLTSYFKSAYREIERIQEGTVEKRQAQIGGALSSELHVGDIVMVKRPPDDDRLGGPKRFRAKTFKNLYRIKTKISPGTYKIEDLVDPLLALPCSDRQHADRLVRVELPELSLEAGQPRLLEIMDPSADRWVRWRIVNFAVDGRVKLKCEDEGQVGRYEWRDLSESRYRWVR